MRKKYVSFKRKDIYAVYCKASSMIFYNLDFDFRVKIILIR